MLRAPSAILCAPATFALGLFMAVLLTAPQACALELRDEPLSIANEKGQAEDEPVGENVGEPAPEDGPVEGEPGPGDTVAVPPDDPADAGPADVPVGPDAPKP
jgi:hypothetical protein